jgi:hypothetical protein
VGGYRARLGLGMKMETKRREKGEAVISQSISGTAYLKGTKLLSSKMSSHL